MSPLPASGNDLAAFLAEGPTRGSARPGVGWRIAARRSSSLLGASSFPTADASVAETFSGIRRPQGLRARRGPATAPVLNARSPTATDSASVAERHSLPKLSKPSERRASDMGANTALLTPIRQLAARAASMLGDVSERLPRSHARVEGREKLRRSLARREARANSCKAADSSRLRV